MSKQAFFPSAPRILRLPAVLDRTGLARSSVYRMMTEGTFPKAVPIGARAVGWSEAAIDAWIDTRIGGNFTSDL
ncbi:AlpA family transcriptional regulator [Paraburkholderia sp. RAU2J]|uniref:helix-turn-helix transcriptional regulator n=1 Tax=Paraburkholderia sp. RAU2J TaxID=1938810 RepID=UPI000EB1DC1D|nr:AlpA family transcriptional regulator [Paraburkholderia sp. RAU2J]RKT24442.1 AlpA family transcriptional regulator [Paraburkholderia sp. RAU2J]